MSTASIVQERNGAVAILRIDRQHAANALAEPDLEQLASGLSGYLADPEVRGIILTGSGEKFFCAGADIAELAGNVPDIGAHLAYWHRVVDLLETSEKPVIAALNGVAVGGGFELALACHLRVAASHARVGLPELRFGMFPAAGGIRRLTKLIGAGKTRDLVLSAELIPADQAHVLGIVERIAASADLASVTLSVACQWARFEPNAVRAVLMCAHAAENRTDTNDLETKLFQDCYATERNRELLRDFRAQSSRQRPAPSKQEVIQ
ncbi:MAG: enoyl-CoA hydratase/isomerase family protein [Alphaproteobacteria bacterium]